MWYIQAVIVAVIILVPIIESKKEWIGIAIGLPLYAYALISNRYFFLLEGTPYEKAILFINKIIASPRNGLMYGLLFVTIGVLVAKHWNVIKNQKKLSFCAFVLSYIALIAEFVLLRGRKGIDDLSLHISMIFVCPLLFIFAAQHNKFFMLDTRIIRNCSTAIYVLHAPIIRVLNIFCLLISGQEMNCLALNCCLFAILALALIVVFTRPKGKIYKLVT